MGKKIVLTTGFQLTASTDNVIHIVNNKMIFKLGRTKINMDSVAY